MSDYMEIVIARPYTTSSGEQRTAFTRVGTAWPMKNREGFSLTFDALPVPTMNDKGVIETRVLMMPPRPKDGEQQPRQQSNGYSQDKGSRRIQSNAPPSFEDDDIPGF